jgi:NADH-quinone oxidoreductase subunit N
MSPQLLAFIAAARPEIAVGIGICVVLLADLFAPLARREASYPLAMATLVAGAWVTAAGDPGATVLMPGGAFSADPLARILKLFTFAIVAMVFVYARSYVRTRRLNAGEFHVLGLFALLGILVMISSASFLAMYLGLETVSLALYAMVACERDSPVAAEAAMKYFVLGAIASGCLLYGIAIIYGVTGSINFPEVAAALRSGGALPPAALFGLGFILVGIAFKFGAVPFHMWLPDVYQGAPACVTLFVATAPKVAAFALAVRILVDGLGPLQGDWHTMLAVVAVLSLAIGNLVALVQSNLKRLLAYSTIGHMGFVLLGILAASPQGLQSALFYTLVYAFMTMGAFGIVILMSSGSADADQLDDLKGLNRRSPWFAAVMLLVMVSMIGVPPLAGFYAKWWVLSALLDSGHTWLALTGILFTVIGAFYYLRIIHLMYFDEGSAGEALLQPAMDLRLLLSANALLLLGIGIFPGRLLEICSRALL